MSVNQTLRTAGFCGFEADKLKCMHLAAHEGDGHYDSLTETTFEASMTEEERRMPVRVGTSMEDPVVRAENLARMREERGEES